MDKPLKPFKTLEEQAQKMIGRGCAGEVGEFIEKLRFVNYYRLSGYAFPFRISRDNDRFVAGTTIEEIWKLYRFDRQLRFLVLDAIERIEIALRAQISYVLGAKTAAEGMSNAQFKSKFYNDKYLKSDKRQAIFERIQKTYENSQDPCFVHHREDLGIKKVQKLPVWVFVELAMFGEILDLFRYGFAEPIRAEIAEKFGFSRKNIKEFIALISLFKTARNRCAHHSRIWNHCWVRDVIHFPDESLDSPRILSRAIAPKFLPTGEWTTRFSPQKQTWELTKTVGEQATPSFNRASTFGLLLFCAGFVKKIAPKSRWSARVRAVFEEFELSPEMLRQIGASEGWERHPLFRE